MRVCVCVFVANYRKYIKYKKNSNKHNDIKHSKNMTGNSLQDGYVYYENKLKMLVNVS